ncbi:MAG: twin-arginine translocase subunit TatC [Thermoguttaceae bacterium]|nr:twin-arginine translocase subunit TatC [Thermoguttaceae bacterium]
MVRKRKDEDLFDQSTMSFWEHLDELRRCLIGAITWLIAGFIIALVPLGFAPSLSTMAIDYIQRPLKRALESYYITESVHNLDKQMKDLREKGYSEEIIRIPETRRMTAHEYYILPQDLNKISGNDNITIDPARKSANESLWEVDNFAEAKQTAQERRFQDGSTAENIAQKQRSNEPVMILLWEKTENDPRTKASALSMQESFMIFIKAAIFIGILIGSPGIFYNFWSFVAAGLYPKEKRYVYRFLPLSVFLFVSGFLLVFFVVFQMVLEFLLRFNAGMGIEPDPRISEWLKFAMILPLGFGIGFQLPLVMFVLERLRIFSIAVYLEKWRISILVMAAISVFLTPPDPSSMLIMLTALVMLYFGGIFLCWIFPRPKSEFDDDFENGA